LSDWYVDQGGPVALWRAWADDVQGEAINGGHFFPEEAADQTATTLIRFFGR
jgi:haloacetate dehalogenase